MMRITVDGTTHPIHDEATGVRVYLRDDADFDAEVQVVLDRTRQTLVLSIAGEVELSRDARDFTHIRVVPTPRPLVKAKKA